MVVKIKKKSLKPVKKGLSKAKPASRAGKLKPVKKGLVKNKAARMAKNKKNSFKAGFKKARKR